MLAYEHLPLSEADPIMASVARFHADHRPEKVNLGVGIYYDEAGRIPVLGAVTEASRRLLAENAPHNYLPMDGLPGFGAAIQALLFGADAPILGERRATTLQTLGGTGALRVGAEFLRSVQQDALVAISTPSWVNHPVLFGAAGLRLAQYPYFDAALGGVDMPAMLAGIAALERGSVVLLHAGCHNPTGADIAVADWPRLIALLAERDLLPFIDFAYQGFAAGLDEDALPVRLLAASGVPFLVASSCSKSFSLYGERVGALTVVAAGPDAAPGIAARLAGITRAQYSTAPMHGAALVHAILTDAPLRARWIGELDAMRARVQTMRQGLADRLAALSGGHGGNSDAIARQAGLFSYTGLSAAQIGRLAQDHAIHAIDDGRICIAALNTGNLDRVAAAMAAVMG